MTTATYTDRTLAVRGLNLHYQEWGDPSLPSVLMLHGFGVSGHMFDEFAERAKDQFHLVALDQRGHGDSDWATDGDYSRDAFIEDVEAFAQSAGLDQFLLVGHSMGGLNSVAYTVRYPHRVQALVLVDVGPEAAKEGVDNIMRFTRGPDELEFHEFVENAMRFNTRRTRENIEERMRHRLKPGENGKWTWKFDKRFRQPESGLRVGSEMTNDQTWELFRAIPCPVLLVRGAESDVLKQETAERCIAELQECSLVTVPGAGHSVPGDNPDGFAQPVLAFLEQHKERVAFEPVAPAAAVAVEEGPSLSTLVETNEAAEARRRAGATTAILLAAGAAIGVVAIGLAMRRRSAQKAAADAQAAAEAEANARRHETLDAARERAVALAGDLSHLAKSGAAQARSRLSDLEVDNARQSALEIAHLLGEQGRAAPAKVRRVAAGARGKAAARGGAHAARTSGSTALSAAKMAMQAASLLVALAGSSKKEKKHRSRELPTPARKLIAWRK